MKFSKKVVSVCAVAMSTCFMAQVPQVADAATSPLAPVWWIAKKGAKAGFNYASDKFYNVKPSIKKGKYGIESTPGSITLNGSKYGASAMYNVKSLSTKHSLALHATGGVTTLFKKYSLIVINPKGNFTINTSITTGVYRGFKFGLKGTYKVLFVANNKYKLAPIISYRYDSGNKTFGTRVAARNRTTTNTAPVTMENGDYVSVAGYGDLTRPSWGASTVDEKKSSDTLTVSELYDQMMDNGSAVYSVKSYKAGDTIKVSDTVTGLEYDQEADATKLFFNNDADVYLEYCGDLTSAIKPGDHFTKEMPVVQLGNSSMFRLPTYFKYVVDNPGSYPSYY